MNSAQLRLFNPDNQDTHASKNAKASSSCHHTLKNVIDQFAAILDAILEEPDNYDSSLLSAMTSVNSLATTLEALEYSIEASHLNAPEYSELLIRSLIAIMDETYDTLRKILLTISPTPTPAKKKGRMPKQKILIQSQPSSSHAATAAHGVHISLPRID